MKGTARAGACAPVEATFGFVDALASIRRKEYAQGPETAQSPSRRGLRRRVRSPRREPAPTRPPRGLYQARRFRYLVTVRGAGSLHPAPSRGAPLSLRKSFITGLIILIPIVLTVKTLWWVFSYVDGIARPLLERWAGRPIPGVGFVGTIAVVFLTGLLLSGGPLRRLFEGFEDIFESVPFVGSFYATVKKVLAGFGGDGSPKAFQRFVLARLPGRTTPGFLTGSFDLSRADGASERLCTVYIPTNHLYVGDVVVVPARD